MPKIKPPAFVEAVFFYYPLSPAGTVLFAAVLYILGKSYPQKNTYGLFLSLAGLFILVLLIILGRIQAKRFSAASPIWDSSEALYAGRKGTFEVVHIPTVRSFIFFRVHFRLTGKLKTDADSHMPFYAESSFSGGGFLRLPLAFPVSGLARVRGVLMVRDIFGITRARFLDAMRRELPVQPKLLPESSKISLDTMGGFDSKNRRKNSDEEKYYMREYIPGDRIRDINWKASNRVNKFITRISPVTQEKTKVLYIDVRTFRERGPGTLDAVLHLDFMKSRLVTFLWNVKRDHEDYSFVVRTGRDEYMIDALNDIVKLASAISALWFHNDRTLFPELPASSRLFIFTTAFDTALGQAAAYYAGYTLTVMTTSHVETRELWKYGDEVTEAALFTTPGIYLPTAWALRRTQGWRAVGAGLGGGATDARPLSCTLFPRRRNSNKMGGDRH